MQAPVKRVVAITGIVLVALWCCYSLGYEALREDFAALTMLLIALGFPALAGAWIVKLRRAGQTEQADIALAVTFIGSLAIGWLIDIGEARREDANCVEP
jgi:heme A synthase